ncbi:PREDICTED: PRUPE_8G118300 [Prunus dulcis]|uniref:PREDICTED: PRUPE_8G118300 n=1 Tax=Prunus dulcis TaxID=3755 RepID=A0A5E4EIJ5_PRUDU|nr:PREDICTED: PRUPE_8G118300 [Prunus dulcis]
MELAHGVQKVITGTDVGRLVVTKQMLAVIKTHRDYEFKLAVRPGRYLKPVLQSGGWRAFVNDRAIAVGDVLCFWEEENPTYQAQYRIALFKPHLFPGHPDLRGV